MADPTAPVRFDDDEMQTWSAAATVLEWLPGALDAQLVLDSGITHFEYGILFALSEAPDRTLRMSTLARYSNSSLSRLSRAMARLEKKAYTCRESDPTDGRYTLAVLTAEGGRRVEQATPGHVEHVRRLVFDVLTTTQAREFREISHRILGAMRHEDGWQPPSDVGTAR